MVKKKLDLKTLELPDRQKRRGSFIVRLALRRVKLRQNRAALKAASRMVLLMPLVQTALLVGVLNEALWMLLLGLEGFLIAWLAAGQLARPNPESKLMGYGITLMNALLLSVVGLFLGSHVYWVVAVIGLIPISALVFSVTGANSVKRAWIAFILPLLLLSTFCVAGRIALIHSKGMEDAESRTMHLQVAWYAFQLRGGSGTERALLRLRQSQAAFEAGDYEAAYEFADDGAFDGERSVRPIPVSAIGQDLLDSLLRMKAQAYYNHRWDKQGEIFTPIADDALEDGLLNEPTVQVRWGW